MTGSAWKAVASLAVSLTLFGCSDFGSETVATSSTTSIVVVAPPVSAAELDVCGLLTTEEAADVIDASSVATEAWYFDSPESLSATSGCTFASADPESRSKVLLSVEVFGRSDSAHFFLDRLEHVNDYLEAPGLGERALVPIESVGDFYVVSGPYVILMSVEAADLDALPSDDDAVASELVELVLARLPR